MVNSRLFPWCQLMRQVLLSRASYLRPHMSERDSTSCVLTIRLIPTCISGLQCDSISYQQCRSGSFFTGADYHTTKYVIREGIKAICIQGVISRICRTLTLHVISHMWSCLWKWRNMYCTNMLISFDSSELMNGTVLVRHAAWPTSANIHNKTLREGKIDCYNHICK